MENLADSKISRIKPAAMASGSHSNPEQNRRHRNDLSSHELLKSLGLAKINVSPSHHRKRLADESRHHPDPPHPDDSEMFIIKLPPNPNYYIKPATSMNAIDDKDKKYSVEFKSNGKPGRIYHWNMPVLKKMIGQHKHRSNSRYSNDVNDLIDIKHIPTWPKPWENEMVEKSLPKTYRRHNANFPAKSKSPSYYVPTRSKKNNSKNKTKNDDDNNNVHKYFPGNGKPKSFYVLKKKSQKPFYKKIIP